MDNDKVQLTTEEFLAVKRRCKELYDLETQHPGLVIGRCNGTQKSNRRYFKKMFNSRTSTIRCITYLEDHGGYCNCEIVMNVCPQILEEKDL